MKDKPQLSAEIEEQFDELLDKMGIRQDDENGLYFQFLFDGSDVDKEVKKLKHFLATALEEQRSMFIEEVRNRRATIKWLWGKQKTDDECFLMVMEQVQRIAEFAKLNQLKEEE